LNECQARPRDSDLRAGAAGGNTDSKTSAPLTAATRAQAL
jgi:hypothetical protein